MKRYNVYQRISIDIDGKGCDEHTAQNEFAAYQEGRAWVDNAVINTWASHKLIACLNAPNARAALKQWNEKGTK